MVCVVQMGHEKFAPVAETAALFGGGGGFASGGGGSRIVGDFGFGAFPSFDLVVHGIFVAFPVVFAAEAAWAAGEGAAVGSRMAFDVFTIHISSFP